LSEYTLPELPSKPPLLTPLSSEKKSLLVIKSSPLTSQTKPTPPITPQKTISVFLTKTPSSTKSLEARKFSLLNRIRERSLIQPIDKSASAAWDRGEWCISNLFMYPALPLIKGKN
jgi:hypothetical protein